MDKNSYEKVKLEFELAIIKELYKNNKIGENQYGYAIKKIQKKIDSIQILDNLISSVVDIYV